MGMLCLPLKVWYNKNMATINGGSKPTFNANEVLKAVDLNQATKNWIVDAVPDDSEGAIGDVVFIPGGPGGLPAVGGGKVLQVVRATDSTRITTTSTDFIDAGISVTITPTESTSGILLVWNAYRQMSGPDHYHIAQITDNSDNAISGVEGAPYGGNNTGSDVVATVFAYATPATTSATTYKGRFRSLNGSGSPVGIFNDVNTGQMYAIELADVVVSP
jgi:hypothetical protein